jgi:hypothetical protein
MEKQDLHYTFGDFVAATDRPCRVSSLALLTLLRPWFSRVVNNLVLPAFDDYRPSTDR